MADEPTLPSLPLGKTHRSFIGSTKLSKRVRLHSTSPPPSSDPPLFSSDDDPSAENYASNRRPPKRKFRGPWYSQRPDDTGEDQQRGKRKLQRKFDSAVWMGSDITEGDSDAELLSPTRMPLTPASSQQTVVIRQVSTPYRSSQLKRETLSPEELARDHIEQCLETSKEDIDLSARGLTHLTNTTIKPLSTFAPVYEITQADESFQSLQPALKLFLSSNSLTRLPGEIFQVEGLCVLSLRSNHLQELPSAIGKLKRLYELNIANNCLHYLPYEYLELLSASHRLQSFQIHPNPFYEPEVDDTRAVIDIHSQSHSASPSYPYLKNLGAGWRKAFHCRSYVRFMDINGTLLKGPVLPGDQSLFIVSSLKTRSDLMLRSNRNAILQAPTDDVPSPPHSLRASSKVPSLLELAARSYCQSPYMPDLGQWLGSEEEAPEHLSRLLRDAKSLQEMEAGDRKCTICSRTFIIPRTEWIEWWEIDRQDLCSVASAANPLRQVKNPRDLVERLVPLIRRGCSWKCLPSTRVSHDDVDGDGDAPLQECE